MLSDGSNPFATIWLQKGKITKIGKFVKKDQQTCGI